ncbi:acyltransferase [Pseudonocardiaceae bacterium YIM PH 21723]|nr:acyltransferase [Pseudonocardiaceae bacterium YIM PH 21723]
MELRSRDLVATPTVARRGSSRRLSWDVIRVLAVAAVVFQHVAFQGPILHSELGSPLGTHPLQIGASTLLVISAYFICVTIRKGSTPLWWWKKIARLLPPYLAAVLFTYLVLLLLKPEGWGQPTLRDLVGNLSLLSTWMHTNLIDGSYWTLPLQLLAFTAAALLWPRGLGRGWKITALLWTLVLLPIYLQWGGKVDNAAPWVKDLWNGFGIHRAHLFAVGIAIWLWSQRRMNSVHLGLLLAAAVWAQDVHTADLPSALGVGVMIGLILLATRGPDWSMFFPVRTQVEFLAKISFCVYLLNQEIGYVVSYQLSLLGIDQFTRSLLAVGTVVVLSWLLTVYVEQPLYTWMTTTAAARVARVWQELDVRLIFTKHHMSTSRKRRPARAAQAAIAPRPVRRQLTSQHTPVSGAWERHGDLVPTGRVMLARSAAP